MAALQILAIATAIAAPCPEPKSIDFILLSYLRGSTLALPIDSFI